MKENILRKTPPPLSLHLQNDPYFPNGGAILKVNGHFCPWSLPKLSLELLLLFLNMNWFVSILYKTTVQWTVYSLHNLGGAGLIPGWYMPVILVTNVHPDVIKANRP